jgi:SecD/SecF fusion protein
VALCHDVIIVLGVCSIFNIEMSLFAVASILTLIGYSINDSIVLLAEIKIQEVKHLDEKKKSKKELPFKDLTVGEFMERAINKIFGRSVMTAFTTLLPVIPILAMGKTGLSDFAWIIFVGVIVGAWSTLVVVAPIIKNNVDKTINPHKSEVALEA